MFRHLAICFGLSITSSAVAAPFDASLQALLEMDIQLDEHTPVAQEEQVLRDAFQDMVDAYQELRVEIARATAEEDGLDADGVDAQVAALEHLAYAIETSAIPSTYTDEQAANYSDALAGEAEGLRAQAAAMTGEGDEVAVLLLEGERAMEREDAAEALEIYLAAADHGDAGERAAFAHYKAAWCYRALGRQEAARASMAVAASGSTGPLRQQSLADLASWHVDAGLKREGRRLFRELEALQAWRDLLR